MLKRVVAEMGGKNAIIVDDDADLDEAVQGILTSAFSYAGQKCSACSRVIVMESIYEQFLKRLVEVSRSLRIGPAEEPRAFVGPVIDGELAPPAVASAGNAHQGVENLGGAVEAYLSSHFSGFPNGVPPPGLYHRILKEIEVPLLTAALAATRGNQIRAADLLGLNRNTLRKKIRDLDIQVYRSGS